MIGIQTIRATMLGVQLICLAAAPGAVASGAVAPVKRVHPPAAELIKSYQLAAGVAALRAVHTRSCKGEVERTPSGVTAGAAITPFHGKIELDWKEPGRAREVWDDGKQRTRRISDGEHGWVVGTAEKRRELHVTDRVELSRLAALFQPALVLPLDELAFARVDKVGGREADVLQTKSGELLWLDQETHLPLRLDLFVERVEPSSAGRFYLSQIFFDEWQTVGAMQLPRVMRRVRAEGSTIYRFTEVKQDLELASGLFKIPYFWRK